jgi:hypothetical protein
MFYAGKFCYNSVVKIEIGVYIGQKYQAVYCDLVLLLGGNPLGIFAPHHTITTEGRLLL